VKDQLSRTKAVLAAALKEHAFDLVVIVTVVQREEGFAFECALDGVVPPSATTEIASALRDVADYVEADMNEQTEAWQRGVS
jgi:hypothetical protein